MHQRIEKAAKRFNVSFAEIGQECVTRELPKPIDRENKRIKTKKLP